MYSVIASDLDGTLLAPTHTLSAFTRQSLKHLVNQGAKFIFATGRHHVDVKGIKESLGIEAYMITSNGARVHDKEGNLIKKHNLDAQHVQELLQLAVGFDNIYTHIYTGDSWFVDREIIDEEDFFKDSDFSYQIYDPAKVDHDDVYKLFYTTDDPICLEPIEKLLHEKFPNQFNTAFSSLNCLEIMAKGVSKGAALQEVLQLKGFTLKDCVAFGDGMNDVEMLEMVGKGHIMQNADVRLKVRLPHLEVIGSNEEDAVAHKLLSYFG
ncbi:Cof-type HAD-IIB family hydrolase [Thorsellia kenyensis]|uniref:Cof-type HAD-IIB family hydrolase n=1 Tax=Thorsellia kenyensis TaxID=1549888 RepID=A0ABV6C8A4_9GAMM